MPNERLLPFEHTGNCKTKFAISTYADACSRANHVYISLSGISFEPALTKYMYVMVKPQGETIA